MNFKEEIVFLFESYEKSYEKILSKLNEYNDVEGLDDLINLILCIYENNYLMNYNKLVEHISTLDAFKYSKDPICDSDNNFLNIACSQLNYSKFFHLNDSFINLNVIDAVLMLIELNFYYYSNKQVEFIIRDVVKFVFEGDIICQLTFHVEDFKKGIPVQDYSVEFFQRISNITFANDRVKKLHEELILKYICLKSTDNGISQRLNNTVCISAKYFMACNALKYGRDSIGCEDVVVGYTLALRLLCEDIREYVIKYYDGKSDLKIDDFEKTMDNNDVVSNDGWGFKSFLSLIFAILAFLEVIILCVYIKEWFVPGMEFRDIPILRFGVLIMGFVIARIFYNYLTKGDDINLFEDGRSKVMLIFVVIFIITIIMGISLF